MVVTRLSSRWSRFVNTLNKQAEPATLQAPDGFSYWVQDYPLSYTSEIDNERFAECCPNAIKLDSESAWREACEEERIGPHVREAFEHWIVSSDLAQHLDEIGETVCELFPNVWVWGRTTTGQPMIQDGVFQRIGAKILDHRVELIGGGQ